MKLLLACSTDAAECDVQGRRAADHANIAGQVRFAKRLDIVADKDEMNW